MTLDTTIPFAISFASWFPQALDWLFSAIVLAVIAAVAAAGFIVAGRYLSESAKRALSQTKVLAQTQRGTAVPALATLIGGAGAALAGVFLSKWAGCAVAIAAALCTYVFDALAENKRAKLKAMRWVFAFGAVLPIAAVIVVSIVTGEFGEADPGMKILAVGAALVGILGAVSGLVAAWERRSGDLESESPEMA